MVIWGKKEIKWGDVTRVSREGVGVNAANGLDVINDVWAGPNRWQWARETGEEYFRQWNE